MISLPSWGELVSLKLGEGTGKLPELTSVFFMTSRTKSKQRKDIIETKCS